MPDQSDQYIPILNVEDVKASYCRCVRLNGHAVLVEVSATSLLKRYPVKIEAGCLRVGAN